MDIMKDINLKEAKLRLLEEATEEKYQVVFHDYGGDVPYTEQLFDSEGDADRWVRDHKSYSDNYDDITYYNPEVDNYFDNYHIEKV